MPSFPNLRPPEVRAIIEYLLSGDDKELQSAGPSRSQKYRFAGYHKFLDPEGYPAVAPPWGTLNAINLNTGEYAWKVPLGKSGVGREGLEGYGDGEGGGPITSRVDWFLSARQITIKNLASISQRTVALGDQVTACRQRNTDDLSIRGPAVRRDLCDRRLCEARTRAGRHRESKRRVCRVRIASRLNPWMPRIGGHAVILSSEGYLVIFKTLLAATFGMAVMSGSAMGASVYDLREFH